MPHDCSMILNYRKSIPFEYKFLNERFIDLCVSVSEEGARKEGLIQRAKLAEQTERYDDMAASMKVNPVGKQQNF